MPEFWDQLVNTALLGADKKKLETDLLPSPIRELVETQAGLSNDILLLKTVALSQQYLKAGQSAERIVLPDLPACGKEMLAYASQQASGVLKKLLTDEDRNPHLVQHWLDHCLEKGWIVPPNFLVLLLDLGNDNQFRHLRSLVRRAAGERGAWLAQFNSSWTYLREKDPVLVFAEGKSNERLLALTTIRSRDPAQARQLLESTWESENAPDKARFLALLKEGLSPEDEPFLQRTWDALCQSTTGDKPVNQEIKATAARLLRSIPESDLSQTIAEKVKTYFLKKKKPLATEGKAEISFQLPTKEDPFFSEDFMRSQLGLDNPSKGGSTRTDAEYWLSELLKCIHPAQWEAHFEMTPAEVLTAFAENSWLNKKAKHPAQALFLHSLAEAILLHRQVEWTRAYVALFKGSLPTFLIQLLLPQERETFFQEHIDLSAPHKNRELLIQLSQSQWSLPFTRHVVATLAKGVEKYYYSKENQHFIAGTARYLHPDVVQHLDELLIEKKQERVKQQLRETLIGPICRMLELRCETDAAFLSSC